MILRDIRAWEAYARADVAKSTVRQYRYWLVRFVADTMIERPEDMTLDVLVGWLDTLARQGPTRSVAKRALRHFGTWLRASGRLEHNPAEYLPKTRRRRRMPEYLTEEELTRLVYAAACRNPEWAWALLFVFGTGARIGEACGVQPADVSLETGSVTFRETKNGLDRLVHLGPSATASAASLLNGRPTLLGVSTGAMRARVKRLCEMADLPTSKAHPHILRHTAGTLLIERGAEFRSVQDFLGHLDPEMTALYAHVSSKRAKDTAALL